MTTPLFHGAKQYAEQQLQCVSLQLTFQLRYDTVVILLALVLQGVQVGVKQRRKGSNASIEHRICIVGETYRSISALAQEL